MKVVASGQVQSAAGGNAPSSQKPQIPGTPCCSSQVAVVGEVDSRRLREEGASVHVVCLEVGPSL